MPSTLAKDWSVDGLLLAVQYDFGQMTMGATLKGKLTSAQSKYIDRNATSGPTSTESWLMSTLARVERVRQRNKRLRRRRDSRCER
ncbi:MAG TPA: hypothetical protein VGE81_12130 [Candidatus Limnocylindrales bacterium]